MSQERIQERIQELADILASPVSEAGPYYMAALNEYAQLTGYNPSTLRGRTAAKDHHTRVHRGKQRHNN